jgi:hypothetical protein
MSVQAMTSSVSGTSCRTAASGSVTRAFTADGTAQSFRRSDGAASHASRRWACMAAVQADRP